jgi:hypothetical protein
LIKKYFIFNTINEIGRGKGRGKEWDRDGKRGGERGKHSGQFCGKCAIYIIFL